MDPLSGQLAVELADRGIQAEGLIYQANGCRVYKALDHKLNRHVALKLIQYSMNIDQARPLEEVRIQTTLQHPNVVQLYNYFTCACTQDTWTLALEVELMATDLLRDISNRVTNNYPYTEAEVFEFLFAVSHLLSEAQRLGIAHRDIKPQNIFIQQGFYKLGDFGSALQHFDNSASLSVVGTPIFLSPLLKKALLTGVDRVTHNPYKSDVYSLGMTVVNMALGQLKIGEDPSVQVNKMPYSEWMKQIVLWMLREDERDRPDFIALYTHLYSQKYAVENTVYLQSEEVCEEVQVFQPESVSFAPVQPQSAYTAEISVNRESEDVCGKIQAQQEAPVSAVCIVCDKTIQDPLDAIYQEERSMAVHKKCIAEQWKAEDSQKEKYDWMKIAGVGVGAVVTGYYLLKK